MLRRPTHRTSFTNYKAFKFSISSQCHTPLLRPPHPACQLARRLTCRLASRLTCQLARRLTCRLASRANLYASFSSYLYSSYSVDLYPSFSANPCASFSANLYAQCDFTPYRAHAHKRYSSMNRVPEHDFPTFFALHRTKCKPMHFE